MINSSRCIGSSMMKIDSDMPFLPLHDPQRVRADDRRSDV